MKICLGVLAHNEETNIAATLGDLIKQDLWRCPEHHPGLLVVVNGSTDRTADLARQILSGSGISHEVVELTVAGKANAWNRFVHELSPADADVLILADADIRLPQSDALRRLVQALTEHPEAFAAVDQPVKDIALHTDQGLRGRLSVAASALANSGPISLCGQLYAARATPLRRIFLPEPMLVEDGFIRAMLLTEGFSKPEDIGRLVRAEGVYHIFEAEMRATTVFRHEKRILIGTVSNLLLFDQARALAGDGVAVGDWLRARTQEDPDWFRKLIRERLGNWGGPRIGVMIPVPLGQLRQMRGAAFWRAVPGAAARVALNLVVAAGAAIDLRLGRLRW